MTVTSESNDKAAERIARVALYYSPPASSAWWREGCEWLGRDAESGRENPASSHAWTHSPRRYGWHATIVAPFHPAAGVAWADVLAAARAWASEVRGFDMPVRVAQMNGFMALRAANDEDDARTRAIAASALQAFASLRAEPSVESIERRIHTGMSARQIALLREWGYPYVLDEYRFHMTLSDSLDDTNARASIESHWAQRIGQLGPLPVRGAALFIEREPGAPFMLWQRVPFKTAQDEA
ncbi:MULTISPECIES: DUF1045 domain-containing protein [unclassified Caballeronia]|uniref:DUF1045 domain-containing protein n=1 Tax=unclassified Caballeronia TaxID=2646786 RepID=UPI00285F12D3|nr:MULTISPECIES: DUF1045 domain-containing protein [unclassified Caballeronia]MDR5739939.1 DUF1045 domain-containing protein [Caballeronia sp. LZ016]MDR5807332.1 DUF1045 domain-containing protein [Caballeronia sp. LZ019]